MSSRGEVRGGAILSDGWPDEADAVAVSVADDEVASPPRLLLELLVERRARRHGLGAERFHVLDLDEGGDESIPVLRATANTGSYTTESAKRMRRPLHPSFSPRAAPTDRSCLSRPRQYGPVWPTVRPR